MHLWCMGSGGFKSRRRRRRCGRVHPFPPDPQKVNLGIKLNVTCFFHSPAAFERSKKVVKNITRAPGFADWANGHSQPEKLQNPAHLMLMTEMCVRHQD